LTYLPQRKGSVENSVKVKKTGLKTKGNAQIKRLGPFGNGKKKQTGPPAKEKRPKLISGKVRTAEQAAGKVGENQDKNFNYSRRKKGNINEEVENVETRARHLGKGKNGKSSKT